MADFLDILHLVWNVADFLVVGDELPKHST